MLYKDVKAIYDMLDKFMKDNSTGLDEDGNYIMTLPEHLEHHVVSLYLVVQEYL